MDRYLVLLLVLNFIIINNFNYLIKKFNIYDSPNIKRKKQSYKVSTVGGLIIIINFFSFFLYDILFGLTDSVFSSYRNQFSLYFCGILIYFVGIFDDKYGLSANTRLFLFSVIIIFSITINDNLIIQTLKFDLFNREINLKRFSLIFTVLSILLFINAFNMFDGINLQSGIYSLIFFLYFLTNGIDINFCIMIFFSLIVFIFLNFKNLCYLGNSGSYLLSFIISFLVISNYNEEKITNVETILVLMLMPGLELIRVFCSRIINGHHPFKGDRNHIHHFLIRKYSIIKTNLFLMLLVAIPVLFFSFINPIVGILFGLFTYMIFIIFLKNN
jgi:UDP-GlcNAc:undecaprenyl-phosphate GlcNAc-1-phosphate transferase